LFTLTRPSARGRGDSLCSEPEARADQCWAGAQGGGADSGSGLRRNRGETSLEISTTACRRGMRWRCRCVAKGAAYLCQLHFVEPAIANAAVHCPAVRLHLVSADMVMSAFVMIDEQTHTFGMVLEHARVDDEYASVRDRDAEVGEASVEHIAHTAAA